MQPDSHKNSSSSTPIRRPEVTGFHVHTPVQNSLPKAKPINYLRADPTTRIAAYCVDLCVMFFIFMTLKVIQLKVLHFVLAANITSGVKRPTILLVSGVALAVVTILIQAFYWGFTYTKYGASLGKSILGLQVIDCEQGGNLSFARAIYREMIAKVFATLPLGLGLVIILLREDRRGLHDLLAKSRVDKH